MPGHSMRYMEMAELVRAEMPVGGAEYRMLKLAEDELLSAERSVVHAYGTFRGALRDAAAAGSQRAQDYLDRTTWDLT